MVVAGIALFGIGALASELQSWFRAARSRVPAGLAIPL
jgi:hypothetical protein